MRVLHILPELDGGGVDSIVCNYALNMPENIKWDFVVSSTKEGILENKLKIYGCKIYHIPCIRDNLRGYCGELNSIFKNEKYDIVHVHSDYRALIPFIVAWRNGVKIRITHAHGCELTTSLKGKLERAIITPFTKKSASKLFACGDLVANKIWGNRDINKNQVAVMPNAIDIQKFKFSTEYRKQIRNQYKIQDCFVIGHVGRFADEKNHEFIISIFSKLVKENKNVVLMLIGHGVFKNKIESETKRLGIQDRVLFLGIRSDVYKFLSAMDLFILPSKTEGLPVTLVEVQANGLQSIVSDVVTKEINITSLLSYLPLDQNKWEDKIIESYRTRVIDRDKYYCIMAASQYNISVAAQKIALEYEKLIKKYERW